MTQALGILGIIAWIFLVIALAAGVTYVVVKLSPDDRKKSEGPDAA